MQSNSNQENCMYNLVISEIFEMNKDQRKESDRKMKESTENVSNKSTDDFQKQVEEDQKIPLEEYTGTYCFNSKYLYVTVRNLYSLS